MHVASFVVRSEDESESVATDLAIGYLSGDSHGCRSPGQCDDQGYLSTDFQGTIDCHRQSIFTEIGAACVQQPRIAIGGLQQ